MAITFGTIFGGVGCLCYWLAGYICGASFRHSHEKPASKPSMKDTCGVVDPDLDGPL